jgi:hypothetical protein
MSTVSDTWTKPIEISSACPESADVVIIGGGIAGVATAWFLAKDGVGVVLCEKGHIAGEQSSRNWGWIRKQGRDDRELPMMIESHRIWRSFEEETGEDVGYTEGGCYYLAATDEDVGNYESWMPTAREFELDTRVVQGDELARHIDNPSQNSYRLCGSWCRDRGRPRVGRCNRARYDQDVDRTVRRRRMDIDVLPLDRHLIAAAKSQRHGCTNGTGPENTRRTMFR